METIKIIDEKTIERNGIKYVPAKSNNARFKFTVSDGYCTHEYPLDISGKHSINMIVAKIYDAFGLEKQAGKLIE